MHTGFQFPVCILLFHAPFKQARGEFIRLGDLQSQGFGLDRREVHRTGSAASGGIMVNISYWLPLALGILIENAP